MSKRIVVGLDPSDYSKAALDVACAQAKANDGTVIGVGVVDLPGIEESTIGAGVGASHFAKVTRDKHLAGAEAKVGVLLEQFQAECAARGVRHAIVNERGVPADVIGAAGMGADLIIVGLRTYFHFETQRAAGGTLQELLEEKACPVLAVPAPLELPWRRAILPHDGSLMAARSMRAFVAAAAGLPLERKVLLLGVDDDAEEGAERLRLPGEYLAAHGFEVETRIEDGDPPEQIRDAVLAEQPALVVLGSSGKSSLRAWLFGSVTRTLVAEGTIPLFVAG